MQQCSQAFKDLPGPEYGILGLTKVMFAKDPHRNSALLADKYGPIVRIRVLCFHVSTLLCSEKHLATCSDLNYIGFALLPVFLKA